MNRQPLTTRRPRACASQQAKEKRAQADKVREGRQQANQLVKDRQAQRKAEIDALRAKRGERDQEAVNRDRANKNSTAEQMKADRKKREEQKKQVRHPAEHARACTRFPLPCSLLPRLAPPARRTRRKSSRSLGRGRPRRERWMG